MAKTGKLTCVTCGRTFALPAHLARHRSAAHGAKGGNQRQTSAGPAAATARLPRRGARPAAASSPVGAVLRDLEACRDQLVTRRAQLDSQLAAVDHALSALGATAAGRRVAEQRRAPAGRQGSLRDFVGRVLRAHQGPMAVKEITAAVLKAGYQSRDKTLGHTVAKLLSAMPEVVRVARGQYRLRA